MCIFTIQSLSIYGVFINPLIGNTLPFLSTKELTQIQAADMGNLHVINNSIVGVYNDVLNLSLTDIYQT